MMMMMMTVVMLALLRAEIDSLLVAANYRIIIFSYFWYTVLFLFYHVLYSRDCFSMYWC